MTPTQRLSAVPDAPLRAVRMIRVSKERADMISPDLQRTAIDDYCVARGYVVTAELEGLDESGSASRSPWWRKLEQAVGMVESRQADVIVVWKLSRAARHRRHWAVAVDRVEVAGGRLESATEQFDTATSTGRLARGMLAELAAWEAEVKGEQWRETHAHRLARGLPSSGSPRFGYAYRPGEGYAPNPATAPLLTDLYRRYVAGEGFQALSMSLNAQGVATSRGGRWTPTTSAAARLTECTQKAAPPALHRGRCTGTAGRRRWADGEGGSGHVVRLGDRAGVESGRPLAAAEQQRGDVATAVGLGDRDDNAGEQDDAPHRWSRIVRSLRTGCCTTSLTCTFALSHAGPVRREYDELKSAGSAITPPAGVDATTAWWMASAPSSAAA